VCFTPLVPFVAMIDDSSSILFGQNVWNKANVLLQNGVD
jgi:hypothetical protein